MVPPEIDCLLLSDPLNTYARSDELVKAIIFAGLNNLMIAREFHYVRGRLKIAPSFSNE